MVNVSFLDRFEMLDLLRDGEVQSFRVRERATGRDFEAQFASSADLLPTVDTVIDRGSHEGKVYVVASAPAQAAALDSAGAWRIKPSAQPAPSAPEVPQNLDRPPATSPGCFNCARRPSR